MRHLGQERHVPPDTSGPASLRLAQLPGSPPPARNVERRNRLLDPLIRVELRREMERNLLLPYNEPFVAPQEGRTMIRKGRAVWRGTGKDGTGELTTHSGVLPGTPSPIKTRFESEPGTNPEELIAAAHAGCFTMALAFQLQGAGFTPTELATEAVVSLDKDGEGFKVTKSALTLRATVPDIDRGKFEELARAAEK